MATITGQRARSTSPACDTPRDAETFSPRHDGLSYAPEPAQSARVAWRSVTPRLAGTPHVRVSRDGGRTYPARHVRPLPAEPPRQPCTVPVYDPATGTGRMLALDLDPGRCLSKPAVRNMRRGDRNVTGGCDTQAAELGQLLERIGAQYVADISPSGGRHVYVLFAAPLPWLELRDAVRALALRFPAIDTAPVSSLGGQIGPPGSRHKSGGWRLLTMSLEDAAAVVEHLNGPEVWATLLAELAAELQQVEKSVRPADPSEGSACSAELDDTGVPWVPRLGGRAPARR